MAYNRSLDLIAIGLAAVRAGLPVKAARYMAEAAADDGAESAINAIFSANKKKGPAKKKPKAKAKASLTPEQAQLRAAFRLVADAEGTLEEDEEAEGDEQFEADEADSGTDDDIAETADSDENVSDEEVMHVQDEAAASLRAALMGEDGDDEEGPEAEVGDTEDDTETPSVTARAKARATAVKAAKIEEA